MTVQTPPIEAGIRGEPLKIVAEPGGAAVPAGKVPLDGTISIASGGDVDPAPFREMLA